MPIEKIPPIPPVEDSKNKDQRQEDANKEKPKTNFQEILDSKISESEALEENKNKELKETQSDNDELPKNIKPDFKRENFTGILKDILGENKK